MSCGNRRKLRLNTVAVSLGCSSSCRRPRLSSIFRPKSKSAKHPPAATHHTKHNHRYSDDDDYDYDTATTTSPAYYSEADSSDIKSLRAVQGFGRIGGESVAVEKDSDDPYLDFRRSMLQMIIENQIYSKEDLRELLNCFLQLNSPYYHGIIVRAFTDIWNGVFSSCRKSRAP